MSVPVMVLAYHMWYECISSPKDAMGWVLLLPHFIDYW